MIEYCVIDFPNKACENFNRVTVQDERIDLLIANSNSMYEQISRLNNYCDGLEKMTNDLARRLGDVENVVGMLMRGCKL